MAAPCAFPKVMRSLARSFFSLKQWRARWRVLAAGLLFAGLAVATVRTYDDARDRERAREQAERKSKGKSKLSAQQKNQAARALENEINKALNRTAEGAAVRAVWIEDPSRKNSDTFADTASLRLAGWDSQDGGYRQIMTKPGNYGRPLFTPNGNFVIYTDKQVTRKGGKKHLRPRIHIVGWDGDDPHEIAEGFAVDVRYDPQDGRTWVYALEKILPAKNVSLAGTHLFRFPLDKPALRESVWDRTPLSVDNIQLSRDGSRFAGLFPWPHAGVGDIEDAAWRKLENGCWPSMAPDDSYVTWVFDGPHRNLRLFSPDGARRWTINLSSVPGVKGKETYHPRWSNHPRFLTFTGPYMGKKKGSRNAIGSGGKTAEVFVCKLDEKLEKIDSFTRLTHNGSGDFYPDVWISSGSTAALKTFVQKPHAPIRNANAWPVSIDNVRFIWENRQASNELPGEARREGCELNARDVARLTPFHTALLDGGWFEVGEASNASIAAGVRQDGALAVQFVLTEWGAAPLGTAQPLLAWETLEGEPYFQLVRQGGILRAALGRGAERVEHEISHPVAAAAPASVALSLHDGRWAFALNGQAVGGEKPADPKLLAEWPMGRLVLGGRSAPDKGWRASIERLSVHTAKFSAGQWAAQAKQNQEAVKSRAWPGRIRVRARLLEATEPDLERLDTYHRMLADHTYEVTSVLEGSCQDKKLLVLHWVALDDRAVPGYPREIGKEYELALESYKDHPELEGELTDLASSEFGLPMYVDAATPPGPVP